MCKCRISNSKMYKLFSLGELYISDFVPVNSTDEPKRADLTLCFSDKSKLVQLEKSPLTKFLYGKYWYRSGINFSMRNALKNVVDSIFIYTSIKENDVWLDIASNDGTLLSFVPSNIIRIGIDPAENSYKDEAIRYSDDIIQDYFSANVYKKSRYGHRKANIITTIAMFYDLDNPGSFLDDINEILDDDGLFVLQLSYTPLMINQLAFDNICHEHVCYYSLTSLKYLLDQKDLRIVDCELNDVNGGSFRLYIKKKKSSITNFKTTPFRDVADFRIQSLLQYEDNNGFNTEVTYLDFYRKILNLREETIGFIKDQNKKGKTIWAYGASTKGNTLLQWYELNSDMIQGVAERSPHKYGLKTVGTNIPIYSEEEMRKVKPDYLLILPWHFVEEFKKREEEYLKSGGTFIVPCPKFEIIR